METATPSDAELLFDWLEHDQEASFRILVKRYAGLVHMAALRTCEGNNTLATEASQLTFIVLVRKARWLGSRKSLAGWLHLTAVMQVKNLVRQTRRETRKRQQLQATMETDFGSLSEDPPGREIQPVLDQALAALSAKDREALLLRFYRSLSIREIAATLGIAADAAQKRIGRASDRLRTQLVRRGCQEGALTGTALAAVLSTGFAPGTHAAALPMASMLSSQALASSTPAAGASTYFNLTALKTTSFIPPAFALLLATAWLVPKYKALSEGRKENAAIDTRIASSHARAGDTANIMAQKAARLEKSVRTVGSLDWKELGALFVADRNDIPGNLKRAQAEQELPKRLAAMTREELADALDQIIVLSQSMDEKNSSRLMGTLGRYLFTPLTKGHPQFTLNRFIGYLQNSRGSFNLAADLSPALGVWAGTDPGAASAWLDAQVAAGHFANKTLKGESPARFWFESALMPSLLRSSPEETARRLEPMSTDQRRQILVSITDDVGKDGQAALISLARAQLSQEDRSRVISSMIPDTRGMEDLPKTLVFLNDIQASPEERAAGIGQAAQAILSGQIYTRKMKVEDLADLRPWVIANAPAQADHISGELLWYVCINRGQRSFVEMAEVASRYDLESGGQEVLASFLESSSGQENREPARQLAVTLKDAERRARILKSLE